MPGLEDLYREIILDHYRAPRNRGELPVPPAAKAEGFNPLCGDEVVLYLDVDPETQTVRDIKIAGQGCSISQASTSMMSAAVKGQPVDDARQLIRAFKALMSIHESKLEGDGEADEHGVCVRAGHHCAMPLMQVLGVPATTRASTYLYNDEADVDALVESLARAEQFFTG